MSSADFNAIVRAALGRGALPPTRELEHDPPVGDLIGRGKPGPAVMRPRPMSNANVNDRIRRAARIVRDVQLRDGLAIDLDDPWR